MHRALLSAVMAVTCVCVARASTDGPRKVSVDQLAKIVEEGQGAIDSDLAPKLAAFELTNRLNGARLVAMTNELPGDKSRLALLMIADRSMFLPPPPDEIPSDPTPGSAAARQMLVKMVNYVNTTVRQLPNLIAMRLTDGFEDRPREEMLTSTGVESLGSLPLHWVGSLSMEVTYRDRQEVEDKSVKAKKEGSGVAGLMTTGEFGPILSTVLADAVKGNKITWARWEKSSDGTLAVFHYQVPENRSNYRVKFCCRIFAPDGSPNRELFDEIAAYHGDIAFDPADGSIRMLTLSAEMPQGDLVTGARIAIVYAKTDIGGHDYICPVMSVSMLEAHITQQSAAYSQTNYQGPVKTFLNNVTFSDYRRFGSELKILTGSAGE